MVADIVCDGAGAMTAKAASPNSDVEGCLAGASVLAGSAESVGSRELVSCPSPQATKQVVAYRS